MLDVGAGATAPALTVLICGLRCSGSFGVDCFGCWLPPSACVTAASELPPPSWRDMQQGHALLVRDYSGSVGRVHAPGVLRTTQQGGSTLVANRGSDTLTPFPVPCFFRFRFRFRSSGFAFYPPFFAGGVVRRGGEAGKIDSRLREKLLTPPVSPCAHLVLFSGSAWCLRTSYQVFDDGRICVIFQCCSPSRCCSDGLLTPEAQEGNWAQVHTTNDYCIRRS